MLGCESFTRWLVRDTFTSARKLRKIGKFLHPHDLRQNKVQNFFTTQQGLSVIITYDCSHHSSCIYIQAKRLFIGPCHLPKFWAKKPKVTTKVTLTSHQNIKTRGKKRFQICLNAQLSQARSLDVIEPNPSAV